MKKIILTRNEVLAIRNLCGEIAHGFAIMSMKGMEIKRDFPQVGKFEITMETSEFENGVVAVWDNEHFKLLKVELKQR